MHEASRLASEQMALLESIGDPNLTVGLTFVPFINWFDAGEFGELLRWSQTVIDLAEGDPTKGAGFGMGSPLALALAFRGVASWWLGRPGWRQDFDDASTMGRNSDATTLSRWSPPGAMGGSSSGYFEPTTHALRIMRRSPAERRKRQQRYRIDFREVRARAPCC